MVAVVDIISGGADAEQQRDGDWIGHDERYERTDEICDDHESPVDIPKIPFDFEGQFYETSEKEFLRCMPPNNHTYRSISAARRTPPCASCEAL